MARKRESQGASLKKAKHLFFKENKGSCFMKKMPLKNEVKDEKGILEHPTDEVGVCWCW